MFVIVPSNFRFYLSVKWKFIQLQILQEATFDSTPFIYCGITFGTEHQSLPDSFLWFSCSKRQWLSVKTFDQKMCLVPMRPMNAWLTLFFSVMETKNTTVVRKNKYYLIKVSQIEPMTQSNQHCLSPAYSYDVVSSVHSIPENTLFHDSYCITGTQLFSLMLIYQAFWLHSPKPHPVYKTSRCVGYTRHL